MALYIQISGKNFSVPNKIIIGRGGPFAHLNSNHEVARAQLLLLNNKKGVFIKDLDSPKGTLVNGTKIKASKLVQIKAADVVEFGGEKLTLLTEPPTEFDTVQKIQATGAELVTRRNLILEVVAYLAVLGWGFSGETFKFVPVFIAAGLVRFSFYRLALRMRRIVVDQINFGDDGFTIFRLDGSNMSYTKENLQHWSQNKTTFSVTERGVTSEIEAGAKDQELRTYLTEYFRAKERPHQARNLLSLLILIVPVVLFIIFYLLRSPDRPWASLLLGILCVGWTVLLIGAAANEGLHVFLFQKDHDVKLRLGCVIAAAYLWHCFDSHHDTFKSLRAYRSCSETSPRACPAINFHLLDASGLGQLDSKKIELACKKGNESACKKRAFSERQSALDSE